MVEGLWGERDLEIEFKKSAHRSKHVAHAQVPSKKQSQLEQCHWVFLCRWVLPSPTPALQKKERTPGWCLLTMSCDSVLLSRSQKKKNAQKEQIQRHVSLGNQSPRRYFNFLPSAFSKRGFVHDIAPEVT